MIMKRKSTPIQKKLLRVIMLVSGSVLLLTFAAFFIYEYITYRELTRTELQTLGQVTAGNSTAALAFDDKEGASEILQALKAQKHIVAACLFDTSGRLFASYPSPLSKTLLPSSLLKNGYRFKENYIEGFEPVTQEGKHLGTLYLRSDTKAIYNRFLLYGTIALAFILLSFLFAYLLSKRLQSSISDPILELAEKASIVSDKRDYSVRAEARSDDEIGVLTHAFNHMLTQIQNQNDEINALNANLEEKIRIRTKELQTANEALFKQNKFTQTIIDSSVDVIAVLDRELNYVVVNKQSELVYNKTKEELVGKNILEMFPELKNSSFIANIHRALNGEFIHQEIYKSVAPDHYFENFFIPLRDNANNVDRVLAIAHDITSIMQANEELKQLNKELEKSNRDLEQFAYVASHDLQEPLRKIQIFSELSERNLQQPETAKQYIDKIHSSARRMSDLIKAVLNYSRLSRNDTAFADVDLNEVIGSLLVDLELLIEEKKAIIKYDKLPVIKGIPLQLNQLFLNLFSNSLKFTERQPEITITSSFVSAEQITATDLSKNGGNYAEIIFSDNGIGFDQQYAGQIFAIFQRLHPNTAYAGTGIGLALCKKIVENHGGQILVKSAQGVGTSFFIYLPADVSLQKTHKTQSDITANSNR